jgi:hypothetical protein
MNPAVTPDYDHVIPLNIAIDRLLRSSGEPDEVKSILDDWVLSCLITREEHTRLKDLGLQSSMPPGWDGRDKFARYRAAGIEVVD